MRSKKVMIVNRLAFGKNGFFLAPLKGRSSIPLGRGRGGGCGLKRKGNLPPHRLV